MDLSTKHGGDTDTAACTAQAAVSLSTANAQNGNSSALFPPFQKRCDAEDLLTELLGVSALRVRRGPVAAARYAAGSGPDLAEFDFESPRDLEDLLAWTVHHMETGIVHVTHPRYFGLFNPAPSFPAQCGDRIAANFNPQLASSKTSPFPVDVEAHVIGAIAARAGLPACTVGHFTSGGSEANYAGLICALTAAHAGFAEFGARAFDGPPVFYVSEESHRAWVKIAHQAGIGRRAMRLVATDGAGRLNVQALAANIVADRAAGYVPVMIAATAGTTGGGMIDPLHACADIAEREGVWLHVDAAWGGAAITSPRLKPLLSGIERAHSTTMDAHKWWATTMGCGMFLCSRPDVLVRAFQVVMECMPSNIPERDPYVTTGQWSRRFNGLRLFLALAAAGWQGYADHVERAVAQAAIVKSRLVENGWTCLNDSALAVLCMQPPRGAPPVEDCVRTIVESGAAWVSAISFEGQQAVRVCITNGESTDEDLQVLVDALTAAVG